MQCHPVKRPLQQSASLSPLCPCVDVSQSSLRGLSGQAGNLSSKTMKSLLSVSIEQIPHADKPSVKVWEWSISCYAGEFGGYCATKADAQNDLSKVLKAETGLDIGSRAFQRAIGLVS